MTPSKQRSTKNKTPLSIKKASLYIQSLSPQQRMNYINQKKTLTDFAISSGISKATAYRQKDLIEAMLLGKVFYFEIGEE